VRGLSGTEAVIGALLVQTALVEKGWIMYSLYSLYLKWWRNQHVPGVV